MLSRRYFVAASTSTLLLPSLARSQVTKYPFTLGVASGSPRDTSVVLWTRLAPEPLKGGGMPVGAVTVRYRVCSDAAMKKTVMEGDVMTSDAKAHSVHVTLRNLKPGREYWYQFYFADAESPIGRTRTSNPADKSARIALASCSSYEAGHFAAYADIAKWVPDCVVHVGDYIYEGGATPIGARTIKFAGKDIVLETVRQNNSGEIISLWQYRNRHALYKTDLSLQAAHAASPWLVAMDDHEIDNNWAADIPEDPWGQTPLEFKVRKLAALQAYYEHMPIEQPPELSGLDSHLQMYGQYRFGPAELFLLDTRQYRSDQVCGENFPGEVSCDALADPTLTMTGREQERWLVDAMAKSVAPFNVLASQTWFAPYRYNDGPAAPAVNMDQWDGYPIQRQRLIDAMATSASKKVVLGGDWHCASAMRIHQDPWNAQSKRIGHNFNGTSISSHCPWWDQLRAAQSFNSHVDYVNGARRGYLRCEVQRDNFIAQFCVLDDPRNAQSASSIDTEIRTRDI